MVAAEACAALIRTGDGCRTSPAVRGVKFPARERPDRLPDARRLDRDGFAGLAAYLAARDARTTHATAGHHSGPSSWRRRDCRLIVRPDGLYPSGVGEPTTALAGVTAEHISGWDAPLTD